MRLTSFVSLKQPVACHLCPSPAAPNCTSAERELPGLVIRLPAVYGPWDRNRRLLPIFKRIFDGRGDIILGRQQAEWRSSIIPY